LPKFDPAKAEKICNGLAGENPCCKFFFVTADRHARSVPFKAANRHEAVLWKRLIGIVHRDLSVELLLMQILNVSIDKDLL
jgi:hypothetical protein